MLAASGGDSHGSIFPLVPQTQLPLSESGQQSSFFVLVSPSLAFTSATLQSSCMARTQCHSNLGCRGTTAPATGSGKPIGSVTAAKRPAPKQTAMQHKSPSSLPSRLYRLQVLGSHSPALIRASPMPWVHTRLPHKGLMAGRTFGNTATEECLPSKPSHASTSPAPVKALQSTLHDAQLV